MIEFPFFSMQQLNLDWVIEKIKGMLSFLPDDGTVGQILRRTTDGAEWSDEETGGGGAVDSVNGQTGTVVLGADDILMNNNESVEDSVTDLKSALDDDESVIGVHRSPKIVTYTQNAFAIPQNTTIKIYTLGGEDLPSNRLNVYDSSGTYIDYFTLNSTYGNARIVNYTKRDVAYIALNSSYAAGIAVVWYEHESISDDVTELQSDYIALNSDVDTLEHIVSDTASVVNNGYYKYSDWANVTWSRQAEGAKPIVSSNANRAAFPELLFVRAGAKIHIEGYEGQKYGRASWTLNAGYYTNTVWDSTWQTNSMDWEITADSYITITIANNTDTTPIAISDVGVIVSIYDSTISRLDERVSDLEASIPERFVPEMEATVNSVRGYLTEPCLVFPKITDIHYAPNTSVFQNYDMSMTLMKYLSHKVAFDFVANTGDNINGSSNQNLMLDYAYHMIEGFKKIPVPYYFCMGNHDTNYDPGEKFTIEQTYSAFMSATKDIVFNDATNGTDFYKDFDELGIRLIFLNTQYLNAYYVADATVTWFRTIALNTDKIVVLCEHMSTIPTQNAYAQSLYNGTDITNAISDFVTNGGTLIQLCGHSHADYAFTTPWLTVFSTCGKFEQVDVESAPYQAIVGYTGELVSPARTVGTATEQAWDVVIVRPKARKLNLVRFGAGNDREFVF